MKTRISKENTGPRKLKKCDRNDRPQPKGRAELKKQRPAVQQNRFTKMLELSTLSASLLQLHDLFGTLVLDFSRDPVQMKISDVTGNYELNISKDSLSEYKVKVLLGRNSKGKPAFMIFLGECQCYPELPEGALELNGDQNEDTGSLVCSFDGESGTEAKIDATVRSDDIEQDTDTKERITKKIEKPVENIEQDAGLIKADASTEVVDVPQSHEISDTEDMTAPLHTLFEGSTWSETAEDSPKKNLVTYETRHVTTPEIQKLKPLTNSDDLVVKVRPNQVPTNLRKVHSSQKKSVASSSTARRKPGKRATYKNNLEGFVKFLMTDKVCGSLLDKIRAPEKVSKAPKRITEQMVNYSDGQEYRVSFSKENDKVKRKGFAEVDRPPNSRETNQSNANDTESTDSGGIKVLFERSKPFEKSAFVEQVKKELEEWQVRGEKTVNVEIVDDAKSSSSTEESDSNVVTVYEDPKTSKKLDTEFDDATSNCCTEAIVEESTQKFFLDLKGKEKPEVTVERNAVTDKNSEFDLFKELNTDGIRKTEKAERYVAPIPLETTSIDDIEAMWMSFVEMFHQSSELSKKLSASCQETVSPASAPEPERGWNLERMEDTIRNLPDCTYPGQHCLPYFVEESLKRANSMLETCRAPNPLPAVIRKPPDTICPPQMLNLSRSKEDSSHGNTFVFSPKHYDVPTVQHIHKHPPLPEKFSKTKSRIFFNPHVSIGDWY